MGDSRFYNGRAFAGPVRRGPVNFIAADAFEDNGVTWRSTMPCDDISDLCHIGFDWTTEHSVVESGPESAYRSSGRLSHQAVAPHCVAITQSDIIEHVARIIVVQYKLPGSPWRTHTIRAGVLGGTVHLRLPVTA